MNRILFLFVLITASLAGSVQAQGQLPLEERTLIHNGDERRYLLYVPPRLNASGPVPLVFVLHGGGGNPEIYVRTTSFIHKAREEGFILVFPAGSGRIPNDLALLTWNAGHCCAYAMQQGVDDIGFFRAMISSLSAEYNIDPDRIYAAGHSNGAIMAYWLAARMSDVFAAVGIVAGTIGGYASPDSDTLIVIPEPVNPVSILHIHGMVDESVRYEGGINAEDTLSRRNDLSVAESIAFWVDVNQCETMPNNTLLDDGMVIIEHYACPLTGAEVKLISIVDGGHSWPGASASRREAADIPSQRISATDEIWNFFAAHPRR